MDDADRLWLTRELILLLARVTEQCQHDRPLRTEWFRARPDLPRGRSGANSMASMTAGVVSQLVNNHDLTTAHLDVIPGLLDLAGHAVQWDRHRGIQAYG